eukprot:5844970-Alexandrium_andersonii.AAC.1
MDTDEACDGCGAGNVPKPWTLMRAAMDDGVRWICDGGNAGNVPKPCALMADAMGDGGAMDVLRETFPSNVH